MDDYCKRSGQIPAFGNWDYSNELPITQYFECARQAGLIRYSSSSGESDPPYIRRSGGGDLYAVDDLKKGYRNVAHPRKLQTRVREKRGAHVKDQSNRQHVVRKVCDVTEPPRKPPPHFDNNSNNNKIKHHKVMAVPVAPTRPSLPVRPPKAVDEDLYKIPPELLHSSKRKKMPGFFSCLVPTCAS